MISVMPGRNMRPNQMKSLWIYFQLSKSILSLLFRNIVNLSSNLCEFLWKCCTLLLLLDPNLYALFVCLLTVTLSLLLESFRGKNAFILIYFSWQPLSRSLMLSFDGWVSWCRVGSCTRWKASTWSWSASMARLGCSITSLLFYIS